MDAFFASVEQRDFPDLKGKPIIVGGGHRGVVAAASYEARKYGIHSAMPSVIAFKRCPHLISIKPRFDRYKEVSLQIRDILTSYTDLVEPLSLDEAFLDVTENKVQQDMAHLIARDIRNQILKETELTASAGISVNKFLAKIASDINKPNGQKTIHPQQVLQFLEELPITKFYGVGKATALKMHNLGIFHGKDLKKWNREKLVRIFGKQGHHYYQIVRGIQHSEVEPNRIRKSIAVEQTYHQDISANNIQEIHQKIEELTTELNRRTRRQSIYGKTLTLKIKYQDFTIHTRSKTTQEFIMPEEVESLAHKLWETRPLNDSVRLLGLSLSSLNTEEHQNQFIQLTIPFKGLIS